MMGLIQTLPIFLGDKDFDCDKFYLLDLFGFQISRFPRSPDLQIPRFPDFQVRKFPDFLIPRFPDFQTQMGPAPPPAMDELSDPNRPLFQRTQGTNTSQGALVRFHEVTTA